MVLTSEQILIVDTVTKLGPEAVGNVVIAGSHGGVYAGFEAARAGVRGVILHDAGVGLDEAGIGSLSYLEDLGIAAAAIDGSTAIIGNGDSLANDGITSFINETAAKLGCVPGQPAMDCALAMRAAPGSSAAVESQTSAERFGVIPTTRTRPTHVYGLIGGAGNGIISAVY